MLRFTEMTDAELLALTETELEELIDLECAYEGIPPLPPKPEEPIKPANLRPDTSLFHFDDIYITDPEEARRAEELFRSFTSIVKLEWFAGASYARYIGAPTIAELKTMEVYTEKAYLAAKADLERFDEETKAFNEQNKLYREISNRREDLNDRIRQRRYDLEERAYRLERHQAEFARYLHLAGGDRAIAETFFRNAMPDAAEEFAAELFTPEPAPEPAPAPAQG